MMAKRASSCSMRLWAAFLVVVVAVASHVIVVKAQLIEGERLAEYHARNYTWPPKPEDYTPNTPGWRKIFERRFRQLDKLGTEGNSYNGYMSAIHAGLMCPNFTESGYVFIGERVILGVCGCHRPFRLSHSTWTHSYFCRRRYGWVTQNTILAGGSRVHRRRWSKN